MSHKHYILGTTPPTGENSDGSPTEEVYSPKVLNGTNFSDYPSESIGVDSSSIGSKEMGMAETSADIPTANPSATVVDMPKDNQSVTVPEKSLMDRYDEIMKELDKQDSKAYETARKAYRENAARSRMMNNANLLSDLAHLGVQVWGASNKPVGSAKVFGKISPDDKYLQQAEAWRQKLSQSYIDEVTNRGRNKRSELLNALYKEQQLEDNRQYRQDMLDRYYVPKATAQAEATQTRAEAYSEGVENQNKNRDKVTEANVNKINAQTGAINTKSENDTNIANSRVNEYNSRAGSNNALARERDARAQNIRDGKPASGSSTQKQTTDDMYETYWKMVQEHPEWSVMTKDMYGRDVPKQSPTLTDVRNALAQHPDYASHKSQTNTTSRTIEGVTTASSAKKQTRTIAGITTSGN